MQAAEQIAIEAYLQYGALFLLAASGWVALFFVWKALERTRAKLDALQAKTIEQVSNLGNLLKELTDNRRLEDLLRESLKR